MPSSVRLAAGVVLTMMVLSACVDTTSGTPSASPSTDSDASSADVTPSEELPARPREITLGGMDPCTLWTGDQLAQLGMAPNPRKTTTTAGDEMCAYDATDRQPPKASLSVSVVLDHGAADQYNPGRGDVVISIDGFPAVRQTGSAAGPRPCVVIVDTAQGQSMDVTLSYGSAEAHLSTAQACELTSKAATFAMQTLQTQR